MSGLDSTMLCMYELRDSTNALVGSYETSEKAMEAVSHVDDWQKLQDRFGSFNGWDTSTAKPGEDPHYTIRDKA